MRIPRQRFTVRRMIAHIVFGTTIALIGKFLLSPEMIGLAGAPPGARCGNNLVMVYMLLGIIGFAYILALKATVLDV